MTDQNVDLRIIVENPPVRFAVQRGKDELLEAVSASAKKLVFEFSVRARLATAAASMGTRLHNAPFRWSNSAARLPP